MRTRMRFLLVAVTVSLTAGTVATAVAGHTASPARSRQPTVTAQYQDKYPYDGKYRFVRLRYKSGGFGGFRGYDPGWHHDYPDAEHNLRTILDAITAIEPGVDPGDIIDIDDPELMKYPIAYLSEPGDWPMTDKEERNLRNYLLKGG